MTSASSAIVTCPSCTTRFKKPRAVDARNTRFRCSRCEAVFTPSPPAAVATPAATSATRTEPRSRRSGYLPRLALLCTLGMLAAISLIGSPYYVLGVAGRLRSPLHPWLKPTGYVGQTAGIIAFALFLTLWLYPLRKKIRWLAFTGPMNRWLDVHIFIGLSVPFLGAIHASWKFEGLIGLGFFSMLLVSLSGIVGKYLYLRIPRSRSGLELTRDEIEDKRRGLIRDIARTATVDPEEIESSLDALSTARKRSGLVGAALSLIVNDVARWRSLRVLRSRWADPGPDGRALPKATVKRMIRLARREFALTQQIQMLTATHRVFGFWHVAHRPIAITALLAVLAHVVKAVALGVTWFW